MIESQLYFIYGHKYKYIKHRIIKQILKNGKQVVLIIHYTTVKLKRNTIDIVELKTSSDDER